nr:double-stranded RNA-binding protein 1-like [Aegilops tauschii subsp. strangulata]
MYKLRLNNVCQERRWATPAYTDRREGPEHVSRFHSTVAVGGAEFSSPEPWSRKLIQAEDLAARAALEDLAARAALEHPSAPPQLLTGEYVCALDRSRFVHACAVAALLAARAAFERHSAPPQLLSEIHLPYKSQLRNYAQELRKDLPLYNTTQSGPHHEPIFKSTVTIDGRTFGSLQDYATKKEAESAAAAAALVAIRQEAKRLEQMLMVQTMSDTNPRHVLPEKEDSPKSTVHTQEECFEGDTCKKQKRMDVDELYFQNSKNTTATLVACAKCGCSKATDQIKIYRRHPGMVLPDGATILPFSDDECVAVRLSSPQP